MPPTLGMNLIGLTSAVRMIKNVRDTYGRRVGYVVGVGANYGAYVEFGTSKMRAQPYLMPATGYVMRTKFDVLQAKANSTDDLVRLIALEIEGEAKRRAPVDTGNLMNSISAAPMRGSL
jgi:DUF1365 family protein